MKTFLTVVLMVFGISVWGATDRTIHSLPAKVVPSNADMLPIDDGVNNWRVTVDSLRGGTPQSAPDNVYITSNYVYQSYITNLYVNIAFITNLTVVNEFHGKVSYITNLYVNNSFITNLVTYNITGSNGYFTNFYTEYHTNNYLFVTNLFATNAYVNFFTNNYAFITNLFATNVYLNFVTNNYLFSTNLFATNVYINFLTNSWMVTTNLYATNVYIEYFTNDWYFGTNLFVTNALVINLTNRTSWITNLYAEHLSGFKGYIILASPFDCDGTGTKIYTNDNTKTYFGQGQFNNAADQAANYVDYYITVPEDLDTAVDLKVERFKFQLGGADTGTHRYVISFDSVADSAAYAGSVGDAINLDFAGDASGASGDVETVSNVVLTGWKAAMTKGQLFVIRVARDGNAGEDASTVDSYGGPIVISYGVSQ